MNLKKDNMQYITFVSLTVSLFLLSCHQKTKSSRVSSPGWTSNSNSVERKLSETVWWSGRNRSLELDWNWWRIKNILAYIPA